MNDSVVIFCTVALSSLARHYPILALTSPVFASGYLFFFLHKPMANLTSIVLLVQSSLSHIVDELFHGFFIARFYD